MWPNYNPEDAYLVEDSACHSSVGRCAMDDQVVGTKFVGTNHELRGHGRPNWASGTELLPPGHARVLEEDPPFPGRNMCHYWRRGFRGSAFFRGGEMSSSGIKWKDVGTQKPEDGSDVTNIAVTTMLTSKNTTDTTTTIEFSANEWAKFNIEDLHMIDFIHSS
eukprot:871426-Prymnesium_polylepis.1